MTQTGFSGDALAWTSRQGRCTPELMDPEEAAIRAFVSSAKRERYLGFIASSKGRAKFLHALYHFRDFDPACVVEIAPNEQKPDAIERILIGRGAPKTCYVVSTNRDWDRQTLVLSNALEAIVGGGDHGTLLSCIAGRLAYFEGEGPGERFILVQASVARTPSLRGG